MMRAFAKLSLPIALAAGAALAVPASFSACSSDSPASAGTGGTSSAGGAGGEGTGGGVPPCPSAEPAAGEPCEAVGNRCMFGEPGSPSSITSVPPLYQRASVAAPRVPAPRWR